MNKFAMTSLVLAVALCATIARVANAEDVTHEGTITKIEGATVTVKAADAQHEMTVAPATKVTLDGKPARAADLKVGYRVKCTCEKDGDKSSCKMIEAFSAAG